MRIKYWKSFENKQVGSYKKLAAAERYIEQEKDRENERHLNLK